MPHYNIKKIRATGEKRRWLDALFDVVQKRSRHIFFLMNNLGLSDIGDPYWTKDVFGHLGQFGEPD